MEASRRPPHGPAASARPLRPPALLEVALAVWHLLRLLLSGFATLALYISAPVARLRAAARRSWPAKTRPAPISDLSEGPSPAPVRLLAPLLPADLGKMTVVLDLDETLITSRQAGDLSARLRRGGARSVELDASDGSPSRVVMFMRPGLFEFLARLSTFAEVVLFTAGVPAYAQPLADALDPSQRYFSARLYRQDTVATAWHSYVKDLSKLGRDMRRTVLVDNSPYSFLLQPANGIPCVPFRGGGGDQQLLKVILPLLECLSYLSDIRPVLNNHFKMASWFRARGCNVKLDF